MDHVDDERMMEAFKDEVSSFKNTRHDNIVLFLGYCLDRPKLGIVMNFCRGRPLHEHVHGGAETSAQQQPRLDTPRVLAIAAQVCQGMCYLHGRRILHKDLRSKNVFVEPNNKVVITDFGLFSTARLYSAQEGEDDAKALHVPDHWLRYLAPELMRQLQTRYDRRAPLELPFSTKTDVYAFG